MKVTSIDPKSPVNPTVEAGVVKTIAALDAAWNTHDIKAYSDLCSDDCQWVNVVGMWWNGKDVVRRAHEAFHHAMFKNVSLHTQAIRLKQIAPHVVIVIADTHLDAYTTPSGHPVPPTLNRNTIVLKESHGSWLIESNQVTPIDQMAARFDPGAEKGNP